MIFLYCFVCNALNIRKMKLNHTQTELEGDLFSGLEEQETIQPEASPYDKILESRKNATFAAEQIESQDEVQVVEKAEVPVAEPVVEETPKIEYHAYPIEEVKAAAKAYFHGDALAGDVWANKYALKDSDGNTYELTPDEMHHRIAREIARIERRYPNPMKEEEIFEVLKDFRYIVPQGSPMAGIGTTSRFHRCRTASSSATTAIPTHTAAS